MVFLIQFFYIIIALFPMWDIAIFHENAGLKKYILICCRRPNWLSKQKKRIFGDKKSSWSYWCLIFKDIFIRTWDIKGQRMVQSKSPIPFSFRSYLIGVYDHSSMHVKNGDPGCIFQNFPPLTYSDLWWPLKIF